jgi:hypothetical protein
MDSIRTLFLLLLSVSSIGYSTRFIPEESSFSCHLMDFYNFKHIVLIGDSHMHYQYLALVYALRHCNEISERQAPSMVEHNWNSWSTMFVGTNAILNPFETCDCFRNDVDFFPGEVFGNRYYWDPHRKVRITYMNFGWNFQFSQGRDISRTILDDSKEGLWKYSLSDAIRNHIPRLNPGADVLLLNAGYFTNHFNNASYADEVVESIKYIGIAKIYWRTTTYNRLEKSSPELSHRNVENAWETDTAMCARQDIGCLNVSWTKSLPDNAWLQKDNYHFKAHYYSLMNRQFLQELRG